MTRDLERIIVRLANRVEAGGDHIHLMLPEELSQGDKNTITLRFPTWNVRFEGHCIWMFRKEGVV